MPDPGPDPVIVLGAGIVGICTALSLAERGLKVHLIDREAPGHQTSFGNAGVISPWSIIPQSLPGIWRSIPRLMFGPARPLSVRAAAWPRMIPWGLRFLSRARPETVRATADAMELLCAPSIDLYRHHLGGTGATDLIRDSLYVHAFRDGSRATLDAIDYRIRQEKGAPLELIGQDALHRLEPALNPGFQAAILIHGQARTVSPGRLGRVLADKARSLGVTLTTATVTGLKQATDTTWQVHSSGQTFTARRVVLSMGVWSADLLRPLGLPVPLMAERGYHIECPDPAITLNNSVMDTEAKVVASSMEGGLRIAGQAEFGPIDAPPDPRRRGQLLRIGRALCPDLNSDNARFWMGRRPSFPDSLPALGEVAGHPGLFANFGHAHHGLMMAPKSGELIAQLLAGDRLNVDLAPFAPTRFAT